MPTIKNFFLSTLSLWGQLSEKQGFWRMCRLAFI